MIILSHWYDPSYVGMEKLVKKSLSCMPFCGFQLENQILDHTTLCIIRNEIVAKKAYDRLLKKINKELEKYQAILKIEAIVDASITMRPIAPKGAPTYVVKHRKDNGKSKSVKEKQGKKRDLIRNKHSKKMAQ
ncbi:MAG: transposase [Flavobacteriales bacterium Tduv]